MPNPVERGPYLFCPKSGRFIGCKPGFECLRWTFPFVGLASLVWYLIRVIPKPDRADYPCQRVAMPIAWGFLASLAGWVVAVLAARKAGQFFSGGRRVFAALFFMGAIAGALVGFHASSDRAEAYVPTDPPNSPMGTARGIHPGRVAWVYDPTATPWDGNTATGHWWDDTGTRQESVDDMLSRGLCSLTGETSDTAAWDALFRHFNQTHGRGTSGYLYGETIVIKINCNNTTDYADNDHQLDASPHAVLAMLRQLVNRVGVPQASITVYESPNTAPTRIIPNRVYDKGHAEFPSVIWADCVGTSGRTPIVWSTNVITFSQYTTNLGSYTLTNGCGRTGTIPTCLRDATYFVNMSLLKCHSTAGVTLTAKNNYGSIKARDHAYIQASGQPMGIYSPLVDLIGHRQIGGNTLLFMIDGLFGSSSVGGAPTRFRLPPFNNGWSSSFFLSQDPVAIDSVGFDLLNSEFGSQGTMPKADNFLHEAALANSPPSGTRYDPENDGTPLTSLGVHEHRNDPRLRQYSRNLGSSNGIELVYASPFPFRMDGATDSPGYAVGEHNGMKLYASLAGNRLYFATRAAGDSNGPTDHLVFVTDCPASLRSPPWSKSGQIAFDSSLDPYLADESANSNVVLYNGGTLRMFAASASTSGVLEGSIDMGEVFGAVPPTIYLSVGPYQTTNGGALISSLQVPEGNGDANIQPNEFLAIPCDAIRDENLDGVFDCQDPGCGFRACAARTNGNGIAIAWPTVPGRRYQLESSTNLIDYSPMGATLQAGPQDFLLRTNDSGAGGPKARFYRISIVE
ncbi:MAG TPA: DUF362 domain-containing protein [Verrucomicrobiae bacterium]|nr:DUF362 domain-containing protein [Verrucomicrobiae bacterium]